MFKELVTFKNFFLQKKIHKSINIHKNEIKTWNKLPMRFVPITKFQFESVFFKNKLINYNNKWFLSKKKTKTSFLKLNKFFYKNLVYFNLRLNFKIKLNYVKRYGILKHTLKIKYFFVRSNLSSLNIFLKQNFFIFKKKKTKYVYIQKNSLVDWLPYFNFTYTKALYYKKNRKQYYFQIIILSSHLTNLWVNFIREYLRNYKLVKKLIYWSYIFKKCKFSQKKLIRLLGDRLEKDEKNNSLI